MLGGILPNSKSESRFDAKKDFYLINESIGSSLKLREGRSGITIVEASVIASITLLLGFALMFISFGWAQVFASDLTRKTDEYIQSFRSLAVIENINYTENNKEIIVRNVSKWKINLTVTEIEFLKDRRVINKVYVQVALGGDESRHLSMPITCQRGDNLTIRIKYIPTALLEKGFPIMVTEQNFICPLSIVSSTCDVPERWAFIDTVDPVTTLSGGLSRTYPVIWIRAPFSSTVDEGVIKLHIYSRKGASSGTSITELPSSGRVPIKISDENIELPCNVTFESSETFLIPRRFEFGGLIEGDEVKIHVSGMIILWRPEDMIAEALIMELGIYEPGNYSIILDIKDCNGETLFENTYDYKAAHGKGSHWDLMYVELSKDFKVTDTYLIRTAIIKSS